MDIESIGGGAGAGLFGAILGYLGFSRRLNKLEDEKQDKNVCEVLHKNMMVIVSDLKDTQGKIFEKIDDINSFLRNNK